MKSDTPFDSLLQSDPTTSPLDTERAEYVALIKEIADKLVTDGATTGDVKLLAHALRELRHCLRVFEEYRGIRKVTVFGSARTRPEHPAYQMAIEFGRRIAEANYMVITGAAAGIMEAGHIGAGREKSFGLNILLPFEQAANSVIQGDPKLMNMRYFFTRKLMLIKESDAIVLFPGGFGTHDEAFEALTLIQTGKSHLFPIVMLEEPGGTYWKRFADFVKDDLLDRGYISPEDLSLFHITDSLDDAVREVTQFHRVYHSHRFVRGELVLRLQRTLSPATLDRLHQDFTGLLTSGGFTPSAALPQEANEPSLAHLSRLRFRFDRTQMGRLRQMIDVVNQEA
ncbi:MAG: TIGR00730 family Rossman fold protein [Fimbriiglobus sp.]